jgi:hypothetical protein
MLLIPHKFLVEFLQSEARNLLLVAASGRAVYCAKGPILSFFRRKSGLEAGARFVAAAFRPARFST